MEKEKNHIGHFVLAIYNVQICVIIELTVISTIYLKIINSIFSFL